MHLYCCQNTLQNFHDHILSVPDEIDIKPICLFGINKHNFTDGLRMLTEKIKAIYADMINCPAEYGLPLEEDIEYSPFNPKAAESHNSAHRLIVLLHTLVQSGDIFGNEIKTDEKALSDALKKLKSIYRVSNSKMILKKLNGFGFRYDRGFSPVPITIQ